MTRPTIRKISIYPANPANDLYEIGDGHGGTYATMTVDQAFDVLRDLFAALVGTDPDQLEISTNWGRSGVTK